MPDTPSKEEVHEFLASINEDLNEFIKSRIQDGILSDKDWSRLFAEPAKAWCWETLGCNKTDCPVREQEDYRCWLVAGTLCGGSKQGVFAEKFGNCTNCDVYKQYHEAPVRALYENISILISHMSDEAFEFHRQASTDALTGLLNRAKFDDIIEHEIKRSKRLDGIPLHLVMFDLDHFKRINDDGGHLIGDHYLAEFARLLRSTTRETDMVFRTGGDEFTVLMVGGDDDAVACYIARVQEAVASWNANQLRPYPYDLAVSIGASNLNRCRYDVSACLAEADMNMYRDKHEHKAGSSPR